MLQRFAVYRVIRIAGVALPAIATYRWLDLRERLGRPAPPATWQRVHERVAGGLHDLGVRLAGFFVKLCQVVGARADTFPEPFIRRLGRFHDAVPARPFDEIRAEIERELGRPLGEVFASVDEAPLAAASLAQVHRAGLRDGSAVVVKVQYAEVARLARIDLACLRLLSRIAGGVSRSFDLRAIIDEIAEFVGLELDFAREAAATERVREGLSGDATVRVPRIHREFTTGKLLVLEYLEGIKVTEVERIRAAGHDVLEVARRIGRLYARMIFRDGFFQADPHPGNLLVMPGTVIGLLDFGLSKELPAGFGEAMADLVTCGLGGDLPGAVAAARRAGFEVADDQATALPGLLLVLFGDREEQSNVLRLVGETPVTRVPSHFGLIVRVMLLLNGLSHRLAPGQLVIQRALVEELAEARAGTASPTATDGLPPGPSAPPMLQMMRWIQWPLALLDECAERFGDAFTVRFPGTPPIVFFSHPEAIRAIFTGDEQELRAGEANARLEPLLGRRSLLILDGDEHLHERRLLQPPFHGDRMLAYGAVMREIATAVIDRWPIGRPFPMHPEMQGVTLDVILRTVFGLDEGPAKKELRAELIDLLDLSSNPDLLLAVRQSAGNGEGNTRAAHFYAARGRVDRLLFAEIAARRRADVSGRDDVLSLLVQARDDEGLPLDDPALRDELVTMLVAGHETTATSLAWAVHHLVEHPEVAARLRDSLAGAPEEVTRLEPLDAVCRETLRLTPIIPLVGRRLTRPMRIGDTDLPAGVVAAPCIYLAHRRAERWPEPDRFRPERFSGAKPTPYEYLPFGGGVRRCLGMAFALVEMKIVLAEIVRRVELRAAPGYAARVVRRNVTLAPSEGMPVVVERRFPS